MQVKCAWDFHSAYPHQWQVTIFEEGGSIWSKISGRMGRPPPTEDSLLQSFFLRKLLSAKL